MAVSKPLRILGCGWRSILRPNFAAGDAITVTGGGFFQVQDISVQPAASRNTGTYNIRVTGSTSTASNVHMFNTGGGLWMFDGCNNVLMQSCLGDNGGGETCLRLKASGGTFANNQFVSGSKPCLWVTGQATSLLFSNDGFSGGGPHSKHNISGIASTGANFTVTTSTNHDFAAGDLVVIRGASVAAYNSTWRVASVTANTVVVTSTLNPGAATATGTAESVSACVLVGNDDGAINESSFSNCLFAAAGASPYGAAGLYFDGRRSANVLSGWNVTGCYYDYGDIGALISAANGPSVRGITLNGGTFIQGTRAVHIDQANSVIVNNIEAGPGTPADDGISASAAVYVYAGPSTPFAQGITIADSLLGMSRDRVTNNAHKYGLLLDSPGINDLSVTGTKLFGSTAAVGMVNSPVAAAQRWKFQNNQLASGSIPISNTTVIPSVASAATIDISALPFDVIKVTGTVNIQTITGGWIGREVTVLHDGALTYVTGGNISVARAAVAGVPTYLVYDGTNWLVK